MMRRYRDVLIVNFIVLIMLIFTVSAKATTGSYADFDWSNFWIYTWSDDDNPLQVSWISKSQEINVETQEGIMWDQDERSSKNWDEELHAEIYFPGSTVQAWAGVSPDRFESIGSQIEVRETAESIGKSIRSGKLEVISGSGLIEFTLPYHIRCDIDEDPLIKSATADSYVYLRVYSNSDPIGNADSDEISVSYADDGSGLWEIKDGLEVWICADEGDIINFYAKAYTSVSQETSVPVPSSFLLVISGVGIVFIRRAKKGFQKKNTYY